MLTMHEDLYKYAYVYRYLEDQECFEQLMAKLTWEQFCAQRECGTTQKILKIAVPIGILGLAAVVCYCAYNKKKEKKEEKRETKKPKVDDVLPAKTKVIRAMNKLNKEILQLNTEISNADMELSVITDEDSTKYARVVRKKESSQRSVLNKENHRKNLVAMLDKLMHSEVETVQSALSSLRPLSPSSEDRDAELRRELEQLLEEQEDKKNL